MKKILLIDDDKDIREIMATILTGKYQIEQACSSEEGYKVLKTYSPDLIVLDVMMEDLNSGFNMARELKTNSTYKNTKILMVTNVDNEMNIDYKSEAGDKDWLPVDSYITKPIDPTDFLQKINSLIGS